jgi:hypothetical protein
MIPRPLFARAIQNWGSIAKAALQQARASTKRPNASNWLPRLVRIWHCRIGSIAANPGPCAARRSRNT